jgi:hypothetical protein
VLIRAVLLFFHQIFVYCIVILFNLFLRNLLIATIVMEFRLRTLPKKYLKRRKLLRPRIIQRKRKGAEIVDEDRSGAANDAQQTRLAGVNSKERHEMSLTINSSPATPALQPSIRNDLPHSSYLDNSPTVTSREQSSPYPDRLSNTESRNRQTSPGPESQITRGHIAATDVDHVDKGRVGEGSSHASKSRMYAIKQSLKTIRRKIRNVGRKMKEKAAMSSGNFGSYLQRIYYR